MKRTWQFRKIRGILSLLLVMFLLSVGLAGCIFEQGGNSSNSGTTGGNTTPIPTLSGSNSDQVREAVITKVRPAVVQITIQTRMGGALGSGVIIDQRGYIVTNDHVIDGARQATVMLAGGASLPAQITGTDPLDDLAVLKINPPANITVATLGDSSQLQVGQEVLAIGNPLGITQTVTNGIVSALGRTVSEGQNGAILLNTIQTDAPINPGNSGGALVDMKGEVIGIPTLTAIDPEFNAPANGVGFAIPSNRVKFIAPQIIQSGRVTNSGRASLGVTIVTVDPILASQNNLPVDHGVLIVRVSPNGPAAQAGLRQGDIIVQLNNKDVNDSQSLQDILLSLNPGNKVPVKFYRGNQQQTVDVTLGELQAGVGHLFQI